MQVRVCSLRDDRVWGAGGAAGSLSTWSAHDAEELLRRYDLHVRARPPHALRSCAPARAKAVWGSLVESRIYFLVRGAAPQRRPERLRVTGAALRYIGAARGAACSGRLNEGPNKGPKPEPRSFPEMGPRSLKFPFARCRVVSSPFLIIYQSYHSPKEKKELLQNEKCDSIYTGLSIHSINSRYIQPYLRYLIQPSLHATAIRSVALLLFTC